MYKRPRPKVAVDNISLGLDSASDSDIRILLDKEEPRDEMGENAQQVDPQPLFSIGARTFLQACEEAFGREQRCVHVKMGWQIIRGNQPLRPIRIGRTGILTWGGRRSEGTCHPYGKSVSTGPEICCLWEL